VVLTGTAVELDAATSRAAFPTRPRALQQLAWVYEELAADEPVVAGKVQRAFDAAGADMPPSWTTVAVTPDRMDFWRSGTPPRKTRFDRDGEGWHHYDVLP
jgi:pyridoxamine 5'-phosphate oxidase